MMQTLRQTEDPQTAIGAIAEDALIDELDISKTPLREALIRLEQTGLITRKPRQGATIFKPSIEEFLRILEVHAALEGQAAGLAARRLTKHQGDELERAVSACEAFERTGNDDDARAYYRLNLNFHKTVAEASGNPFLVDLIKANGRKLMAYYRARYNYRGTIKISAQEHRQIAGLILDRNSREAEAAMCKHVQFDQITAMDLLASVGG